MVMITAINNHVSPLQLTDVQSVQGPSWVVMLSIYLYTYLMYLPMLREYYRMERVLLNGGRKKKESKWKEA